MNVFCGVCGKMAWKAMYAVNDTVPMCVGCYSKHEEPAGVTLNVDFGVATFDAWWLREFGVTRRKDRYLARRAWQAAVDAMRVQLDAMQKRP